MKLHIGGEEKKEGWKILNIQKKENVDFIGDITDAEMLDKVRAAIGGAADGVLSDMAADTTGHRSTDHLRTTALLEAALYFALDILNKNGFFLAKCFRGGAEKSNLCRTSLLPLVSQQRNRSFLRYSAPRSDWTH